MCIQLHRYRYHVRGGLRTRAYQAFLLYFSLASTYIRNSSAIPKQEFLAPDEGIRVQRSLKPKGREEGRVNQVVTQPI